MHKAEKEVAKGKVRERTYFEETNDRCFGMLSEGSGPVSSNDVKFNVGKTGDQLSLRHKGR